MSPLLARVLAMLLVLAVPLGLALASQSLASRPGRPQVPSEAVLLGGDGSTPTSAATPSASDPPPPVSVPTEPVPTQPVPTQPVPTQPTPTGGPQVVDPVPPGVDDGDGGDVTDEDGADDEDGDDG